MTRRGYLDWMRGLAVLIMIEAHTMDAWTQVSDRKRVLFGEAMVVGGFGAPLFLFLAGVALALSAGAKARKTGSDRAASRAVQRRGWEVFALAFLFRLQSYLLNPGSAAMSLLKVDILDIMGPAIVMAAAVWGAVRRPRVRLVLLAASAAAFTLLTPLVRSAAHLLDPLPEPIQWYIRPFPGRTNFTLFPWAGFVFAGAFIGVLLDQARATTDEWRLVWRISATGTVLAVASYYGSYLPSIYAESNFWTSSPAFFLFRVGVLLATMAPAYLWSARPGWSPMEVFGRASLFVYWIHVEMVYGVLMWSLHRALPIEWAFVAFAAFSGFMFALVMLKQRIVERWRLRTVHEAVEQS